MRLYHWTADHLVSRIKAEGITKGSTPVKDDSSLTGVGFLRNHIWLTSDGVYENQTWAIPVSIKYQRRAWRIEVNIPKSHESNLLTMDQVVELLGDRMLLGFNDNREITKNWFVYQGMIPRQWFKSVRKMEMT